MAKKKARVRSSKAITAAMKSLETRFKEVVVMKMSDSNSSAETTPSGRADLDAALGGGYGVGKIIEIYAESGFGKTGLALEAIAECQKEGGVCAFVDSEHALNTEYCEQIGVNVDDLYISQPSYGEQAFEAIRALIATAEVDMIVVDSVAAMVPKAILEGESGEAKIALQARMMSQGMQLIAGPAAVVGCTIIFINQLRKTIAMYGPSETTTGGKALKFYATQRLEVKSKGQLKNGSAPDAEIIGFKQFIKIVKNKIGAPFKTIQNDIVYGIGVDKLTGLIEALIFNEVLIKAGSWLKYKGTNVAQGRAKLRKVLEDNPDLLDELEKELITKTT